MKVIIASDHSGVSLKEHLKSELPFDFNDLGPGILETPVDYPDYAHKLCKLLTSDDNENTDYDFGILICGTGIGMSMTANRYPQIRAALCYNEEVAQFAKRHNNANVLVFGARQMSQDQVLNAIIGFTRASFDGDNRHTRRLLKINNGILKKK